MDRQNYILYRKFNLILISAANLPNVHTYSKPKMYAKVSFCGDKKTEQRTQVDKDGLLNPAWNYTMNYKIAESGITHSGLQLVIKLYCKRRTLRDRYAGEIHKSVKELFDDAHNKGGSDTLSLPITNGSAETGGRFNNTWSGCASFFWS
ncbi:unnamed protein product [Fraxinus pennsylvanica]|uniref:C2 domain-containing protein n=1 Tax=Fraxinus pennsylvanica TaxID=56036 RepID=A0AAD2AJD7_9LAMI|nr:unnamed protein product [Fraxinus pennsylvanica]